MDNDYRPIDCSLHDRYEAAAVRRVPVRVEWQDASGHAGQSSGIIADVLVQGGAEFLIMSDGSKIRLDRITGFELTP